MTQKLHLRANVDAAGTDETLANLRIAREKLREAEQCRQKKSLDRAETICAGLLQQFPSYYGAAHTMGLIKADRGDHRKAIEYLITASILHPKSWSTLTTLAGEYLLLGSKELARRSALQALELAPNEAAVHITLGEIYYSQSEYQLANEHFQTALNADQSIKEGLFGWIRSCLDLGRFGEAASAITLELSQNGPTLELLNLYASLPKTYLDDSTLQEIETFARRMKDTGSENEIASYFIMAAGFDKLGQFGAAWENAVRANELKRKQGAQNILEEQKSIAKRVNWLKSNYSQLRNTALPSSDDPFSLFLLGPSRSGKTTLESLIGQHPDVKRGYESPTLQKAVAAAYGEAGLFSIPTLAYLPINCHQSLREFYTLELLSRGVDGYKVITNTTPGYIWDAPFIARGIPNCRFVFIKRNLPDLIWRMFIKNYRSGNWYSYQFDTILSYVNFYNDVIDVMVHLFPEITLVIDYESVVTNPDDCCDQVFHLCGLKPEQPFNFILPNDVKCSAPYAQYMMRCIPDNVLLR